MRGRLVSLMVIVAAWTALAAAARAAPEGRLPVPDAAARDRADKSVRELLRSDFASRSPSERDALAKRLLDTAAQTRNDPVQRYALLEEALEVACGVGDVPLAERAAQRLADEYDVKGLEVRLRALHLLRPSVRTPQAAYEFLDAALDLCDQAIGDRRGERTMHRRTPVALRDEKDEQVLSIPDPEFGAQWYTIRLTRRKP
jgi:hypothetical protein